MLGVRGLKSIPHKIKRSIKKIIESYIKFTLLLNIWLIIESVQRTKLKIVYTYVKYRDKIFQRECTHYGNGKEGAYDMWVWSSSANTSRMGKRFEPRSAWWLPWPPRNTCKKRCQAQKVHILSVSFLFYMCVFVLQLRWSSFLFYIYVFL